MTTATRKITCAYCEGRGKDPFDLLSALATCQVCGGGGKVSVGSPAVLCAFCSGTGIFPRGARVTCYVCGGKGKVVVRGSTTTCPSCKGSGRSIHSGLPCPQCGGKGVVRKRQ
jgi:DnaJ-class molecular chaperone